ncbi:mucin-17-like [Daphnia carinata]|uniref:mucin-17-like n=1 Tax=Daphnia carinata TaxID=120202 RepID=UPI0025804591|nr:mucin-17-like [Daphnia carinata]
MAEPSTELPTAETTSASGPSLPNNAKVRNKLLALKLNSVNGPKKQPKKAAEKVRIDNLPEAELQALLDEVLQYSGKRDGEKGSELFQALLRETQESGEESPPAFRPTQNTSNPSAAQQRRRRSRKESSVPFSHLNSGVLSVQSNTVAGSNRKGGSLQNISSHSQSERGSVRRRKRHDTSDSGSTLGSPRKREGGSLPCDVARGSNIIVKLDELVLTSTENIHTESSRLTDDCVINMEGMPESEDKFPERWNSRPVRRIESSTSTCGVEPMEQDSEMCSSENAGLTKSLLSKGSKEYGTIRCEVDAAIPFVPFDSTANQEVNRPNTINGSLVEDGIPLQRRIHRHTGGVSDARMDENGNPFGSVNGTSISTLLQRTSPPGTSTINMTSVSNGSGISTPKGVQRIKNKKKGKDGNVLLAKEIPGFVGNRNVDELLEYIESSESNGKKAADKKTGLKHNGTLTKESSAKVKPKDKKSSKLLHRQTNPNQADSEDSDTPGGDSVNSPVRKDEDYMFRSKTEGVEELEAAVAAAAADFQTVTKRQRRKKRNSLSNSTTGSKTKELLEQSHMNNLFYNASSPSVMMRPPRQAPANISGNQVAIQISGGTVGNGLGGSNEAAKKLVASVPPSEPSDLDSDGGDSVHSLPVQPSAPLFPPPPLYHQPPPSGNSISYADIMRSEQHTKSDVVFLAESSQPIDVKQPCATTPPAVGPASLTDLVAPAAPSTAAANVPCNRTAPRSTLSGVPLRRAASLPPTSPSVETPPVVIVGSSSSTQVDVTFGFELNEQLLALSVQPSPPSQPPKETQTSLLSSPEAYTEPIMVSFSPEPSSETKPETEFFPPTSTPLSSSPEMSTTPTAVDFASRYRERPELLNPPHSRRSYEIVDFISQAWKRIERKLDEQQQQRGVGSNGGLALQSSIRVYTLE